LLSDNDVDYLLQVTRSTVKRFGGKGLSLSHLAFVLSDKWSDQFVEVFGSDGPDAIRRLLQRRGFVGDESDVRQLLANGDSKGAILSELHARLKTAIESGEPGEPGPGALDDGEEVAPDRAGQAETVPVVIDSQWPVRTRRFLSKVEPRDDLLERDEAITQVVSIISRRRRRIPIILGARGSGRTTVLGGLVQRLNAQTGVEPRLVRRVAPAELGPAPAEALFHIVEDCEAPTILILDDVDRLASLGTAQPDSDVLSVLRVTARHPKLQVVLVCDVRYYQRLAIHAADFEEDLVTVRLDPLSEDAVTEIVSRAVLSLESEYGVVMSPALRSLACLPARSTDRSVHPGLALDRLDAAASRAKVVGDVEADIAHLSGSVSGSSRPMRAKDLEERLSGRIGGQPNAVRAVAARLALTLARLDLRPQRPDGVFLFVGPTGVGKTELARALSTSLFGSEDRLIRLDMSEYSHDWAVSRLVGPMPGYVGSTEPESWLTTKVMQMPECVVLLDEIEKAHPVVWNTFLQVFDVGRLTDARGSTADFSKAVIVMTSNLGAAAASSSGLGFGSESGEVNQARERIIRAVEEAMPPELINRIDELVVFDALSIDAIEEIAEAELAQACERLAEAGWAITYDRAVVEHLVSTGFDPAYGARHLQRNIERLFLGLIAQANRKTLSVGVVDGELAIRKSKRRSSSK
jgi:ATP-dependent Clp protease ATP-binding subunit ClpA